MRVWVLGWRELRLWTVSSCARIVVLGTQDLIGFLFLLHLRSTFLFRPDSK